MPRRINRTNRRNTKRRNKKRINTKRRNMKRRNTKRRNLKKYMGGGLTKEQLMNMNKDDKILLNTILENASQKNYNICKLQDRTVSTDPHVPSSDAEYEIQLDNFVIRFKDENITEDFGEWVEGETRPLTNLDKGDPIPLKRILGRSNGAECYIMCLDAEYRNEESGTLYLPAKYVFRLGGSEITFNTNNLSQN